MHNKADPASIRDGLSFSCLCSKSFASSACEIEGEGKEAFKAIILKGKDMVTRESVGVNQFSKTALNHSTLNSSQTRDTSNQFVLIAYSPLC